MSDRVIAKEYENDPTDNIAPYGTKDYVRKEFSFVANTRANTLARNYKAGKQSTLIYRAKIDKTALKCVHCYMTCCAPCTCAMCHSKVLTKYTFTHLYDDRIETNIPISFCCWIGDNTRVYYLDRDFAQHWDTAGPCTPCFTHCSCPNKKFGKAVIGYGGVNFIMNPGARRLAVPLIKSCGCSPACQGSPFFGECCTFLPQACVKDWVCFPFIDDDDELISKIKAQREIIVQQYNIVPGKPVEVAPVESEDMSRV